MKVLFLYRELAGYIVRCMNELARSHSVDVHVVAYPIHPDAPFTFEFHPSVRVSSRTSFGRNELVSLIQENAYDLVVCSGWSDAEYLSAIRQCPGVRAAIAFDKQWFGSLRDRLATLYLRLRVTPLFDFAFVAGYEQRLFARRMGFRDSNIYEGVYTCDSDLFNQAYLSRIPAAERSKPRQIWYAGRYVPEKAVMEFFNAVIPLLDSQLAGWELHCMGTGPLWDTRPQHPIVFHHGFVQPTDVVELIRDGEVFIMPSRFEPWCLTVHEFAQAGYALLLSDRVGARWSFLKEGYNGLKFMSGDWEDFKRKLIQLCSTPPENLAQMGVRSHELAEKVNVTGWCQTILAMAR